jgi:predicted dehydrogenase
MAKVKIGLIGTGGFARHRISNLLQVTGAQVVALCDPNADQIDLTKEKYPSLAKVPAYNSTRAMFKEQKLDAVMIMSPHKYHCEQILESFEHKCHVCCEKPLVANKTEMAAVIQARDKVKKTGMVSYQRHTDGNFIWIRDQIASKRYGNVQAVSALLLQEWKRFTVGTWRQNMALSCGGQLNDSGSHMVDILLWTTGLAAKSVSARLDYRGTEVDINSSLSLEFENGALGSITIMGDAPRWTEDITICCDDATFFLRDGKLTIQEETGGIFQVENLPGRGTVDQHFIDVINGKAELRATFEDAQKVVELTQAAFESAALQGQPVLVK